MAKVVIPHALAYYLYYPFWKTFFEKLGHEVVVSTPTTRAILDRGVEETVNDACIPIKIYHGHVASLIDQVDYIFCPRLISVRRHGDFGTETFCPKFLGLPDLIRLTFTGAPPIIDTPIDINQLESKPKSKKDKKRKPAEIMEAACVETGDRLGNSITQSRAAYQKAAQVHQRFLTLLEQGKLPPEAIDILFPPENPISYELENPEFNLAVVGYPYAIYDHYINVGLLNILHKENIKVYTQDTLSDKILNQEASELPKSMFWYFSNRAVYGALYYMKKGYIDGIVHITAFACGPDSMVDRLLEIEARRRGKPYLPISIDEHTGESGVRTRVEAFVDMLRYRRDKK